MKLTCSQLKLLSENANIGPAMIFEAIEDKAKEIMEHCAQLRQTLKPGEELILDAIIKTNNSARAALNWNIEAWGLMEKNRGNTL